MGIRVEQGVGWERRAGLLLVLAATLTLLLATGSRTDRASAADCMVTPYHSFGAGLLVLGASQCGDEDAPPTTERYSAYCHPDGNLHSFFLFEDETGPYPPGNEFIDGPCGLATGVVVNGLGGTDVIDLSRVSAANGFTGITGTNSLDGGSGPDTLIGSGFSDEVTGGDGTDLIQVRDGRSDTVDCGAGLDSVQADQLSVDRISNCEVVDALPEATPPAVSAAAAISPPVATPPAKKCKKTKKKRCKKKRKK